MEDPPTSVEPVHVGGCYSGLTSGEGAALTGSHDDVALVVAAGEDRRQDAICLDTGHALAAQLSFGAHVRFNNDQVRVNVLDGADIYGGDSHWVHSPSTDFAACLSGKRNRLRVGVP